MINASNLERYEDVCFWQRLGLDGGGDVLAVIADGEVPHRDELFLPGLAVLGERKYQPRGRLDV